MTGPEHFREAERLISQVADGAADWEPLAASAQVHATLAVAAATALARDVPIPDWVAWRDTVSIARPVTGEPE